MLTSIINFLKVRKDFLALLIAALLSIVFAKIVFASGLAVGSTLLIFSFLLAFIVCLISDRNTIIVAVISNLIFVACCLVQKYIVLAQPFFGWTSESVIILFVLICVSMFLTLAVSVMFTLIRRETREF